MGKLEVVFSVTAVGANKLDQCKKKKKKLEYSTP